MAFRLRGQYEASEPNSAAPLTCFRNADNENDLLILLDFADAALAKEFVDVVRKVREAAGVIMSTLSVKFLPTE